MADLSGLPENLQSAIENANNRIDQLSAQMESGSISVDEWQQQMETILTETYQDAATAGAETEDVGDLQDNLSNFVAIQFAFVANFATDILANGWQADYRSRAQMYGSAIKQGYWLGDAYRKAGNRVIPLPAMPGEGTQCLTNCKCGWDIETISAGNYNAYWKRHVEDSCQTCIEREAQWNPVRIRDGVLL